MKFFLCFLSLTLSLTVWAQNPEEFIIKSLKLQMAQEKFGKVLKTLETTKKISKDHSSLLIMIHNNLLDQTIKLEEQILEIEEDCSQCVQIKTDFEEISRKFLEDEFKRVLKEITTKITKEQLAAISEDHTLLKEKESDLLKSRQKLVDECHQKLGSKTNPTTTKTKPKVVSTPAPVKPSSSQMIKN
jgi:type IV secretory pathway VirJ component